MALPENYRESQGDNRCDNCMFYVPGINVEHYCTKWNDDVQPGGLCDSWKPIVPRKPGVLNRSQIKGRTA